MKLTEGGKALSRSLKCYPSLSPTLQEAAARFGVGRIKETHDISDEPGRG